MTKFQFSRQNAGTGIRAQKKAVNELITYAGTLSARPNLDMRAWHLQSIADKVFFAFEAEVSPQFEEVFTQLLIRDGWKEGTPEPPTRSVPSNQTPTSDASPQGPEGEENTPEKDLEQRIEDLAPVDLAHLNDPATFQHIFDRETQIKLLLSAANAAFATNFENRYHAILRGPPGSGKTDILSTFAKAVGPEWCTQFDGPSTTRAGAMMHLQERPITPFLLIEELEKMPAYHMTWLLQLLDSRGELRRTDADNGFVVKQAKVICFATVNDYEKLQRMLDGAVASRFAHNVFFPNPSKETMKKILLREIGKVNGNPDWADPALNYCWDVEHSRDPRRFSAVCLSGREGLLDGSYVTALTENNKIKLENSPK